MKTIDNPPIIKNILNLYYENLAKKGDWDYMLADDILLTGTIVKESRGKEQFVNNNFFKMVRDLKVKEMIVEGQKACAAVAYSLCLLKATAFKAKWQKSGKSKTANSSH